MIKRKQNRRVGVRPRRYSIHAEFAREDKRGISARIPE